MEKFDKALCEQTVKELKQVGGGIHITLMI